MKELTKLIDTLPENKEWWKKSSRDTFLSVGKDLLEKGFTIQEAFDILSSLYYATASEFGN